MRYHIDHKAAKGKLMRIAVDIEDGKVISLSLNGDFFIHPEEGIAKIEGALIGALVSETAGHVRRVITKEGLEVIGFTPEDLAEGIKRAQEEG